MIQSSWQFFHICFKQVEITSPLYNGEAGEQQILCTDQSYAPSGEAISLIHVASLEMTTGLCL